MNLAKQNQKNKLYFAVIEVVVCNLVAPCYKKNRQLKDTNRYNKIRHSKKIKKWLIFNHLNVAGYRLVYTVGLFIN